MPLPPLREEVFESPENSQGLKDDRVPGERSMFSEFSKGVLSPPKPLEPLTVVDTPVEFGDIEVSSASAYSDEEEISPRPVRSLKDLVPTFGDKKAGRDLDWAPKSSLDVGQQQRRLSIEQPWNQRGSLDSGSFKPTGSVQSTGSNRASFSSSSVSKERRLSGIPEQNSVKWRLHFRMIGQNAWSLTETLVTRAYEMFPLGEEPGRQQPKRNSVGASFAFSNGSFTGSKSSSGASPFSCHLQLDKLNDYEELGMASARPNRDGMCSQDSLNSNGDKAGEDNPISGSLKCSLLPVEMFAEDVPQYETVESFKQSCTIFLVDPRQENIDEGLSDLMRREREVESRIHACIKQNRVNGVPPLLSVVLIHGPSSIAAPAGAALMDDMPLRPQISNGNDTPCLVPPLAISKLTTSQVAPFSGNQEGKYNKFVEGLKRFSAQAKDDELFYRCNFDDSEALVQSMMRIACKIIVRRRSEDLAPVTLEKLRAGLNTPRKNSCCSLL